MHITKTNIVITQSHTSYVELIVSKEVMKFDHIHLLSLFLLLNSGRICSRQIYCVD
jgi:hypothetical protein